QVVGRERVVVFSRATLYGRAVGQGEGTFLVDRKVDDINLRIELDTAFDKVKRLNDIRDLKTEETFVVDVGIFRAEILIEVASTISLQVRARAIIVSLESRALGVSTNRVSSA